SPSQPISLLVSVLPESKKLDKSPSKKASFEKKPDFVQKALKAQKETDQLARSPTAGTSDEVERRNQSVGGWRMDVKYEEVDDPFASTSSPPRSPVDNQTDQVQYESDETNNHGYFTSTLITDPVRAM